MGIENMTDYEPRQERIEGTDRSAQNEIDATNPATKVDVPNFQNMTQSEVVAWLNQNLAQPEEGAVSIEDQLEERGIEKTDKSFEEYDAGTDKFGEQTAAEDKDVEMNPAQMLQNEIGKLDAMVSTDEITKDEANARMRIFTTEHAEEIKKIPREVMKGIVEAAKRTSLVRKQKNASV